jgi:hypothetical protein
MGCPDAIVGHLAGLQGVKSINFNIENRIFTLVAETFSKKDLIESLSETSTIEKRKFILKSCSEFEM